MTSSPAFTERNIQKANAYLLYSRQEQKSLVKYHTLQSLYVCVWLVNTLTSTAPIGSPIICMWSPADICEQWERNSADVRGAGTRDEPLRKSSWEAREIAKQSVFFSKSVKKSVKRGVRVLRARSARASHARMCSLFSASRVPELLFDYSRVLEYWRKNTDCFAV